MLKFFKYLPLVIGLQDVSVSYTADTPDGRPGYLSRRFIGALLIWAALALKVIEGIELDPGIVQQLSDGIPDIVDSVFAIWGTIMTVVGTVKAQKT